MTPCECFLAQGSEPVGPLFEGESKTPATHYDHDENGKNTSGEIMFFFLCHRGMHDCLRYVAVMFSNYGFKGSQFKFKLFPIGVLYSIKPYITEK